MANNYRWSIDQISNTIADIDNAIQRFTELKEEYSKLPASLSEAYKSDNAESMNLVLQTDVEKYQLLIDNLREVNSNLAKSRRVYVDCEMNMKKSISDMSVKFRN